MDMMDGYMLPRKVINTLWYSDIATEKCTLVDELHTIAMLDYQLEFDWMCT